MKEKCSLCDVGIYNETHIEVHYIVYDETV